MLLNLVFSYSLFCAYKYCNSCMIRLQENVIWNLSNCFYYIFLNLCASSMNKETGPRALWYQKTSYME